MKRPMYHALEINKANEELAADNLRLYERVAELEAFVAAKDAEIERIRKLIRDLENLAGRAHGDADHQDFDPEACKDCELLQRSAAIRSEPDLVGKK